MKHFNVTIKASAARVITEQVASEETIQSEFQVQGADALDASSSAVESFKQDYNMGNMMFLEITDILVELRTED